MVALVGAGRLVSVPAREPSTGWRYSIRAFSILPRYGHALSAGLYAASCSGRCVGARKQFDVVLGTWAYPDGVAAVTLAKALGLPDGGEAARLGHRRLAKRPGPRRQLAWPFRRRRGWWR